MLKEHTLLVTVTLPRGAAMQDALEELGLSAQEVDEEYGLVPIDPDKGLYALLVVESAAARLDDQGNTAAYGGPFANPKIEPFDLR
ncbi:hypothetical protein RB628_06655 [Streptomyces sp. ADMS]|uniref:hypothetical protein n=1 Tax=Streptomyces sp. ADMS TaxID=3071415 RepID=UPI00296EC806|nr:hypothetical protein [Streptomyces sp. ADMS]MDW4905033.1 hypothetical protein [Streptomyces sp. ADMS]